MNREIRSSLNLPAGISVWWVTKPSMCRWGVSTIESSVTLNGMRAEVIGVDPTLDAKASPILVDCDHFRPDSFAGQSQDQRCTVFFVDMTNDPEGIYQRTPQVEIKIPEFEGGIHPAGFD